MGVFYLLVYFLKWRGVFVFSSLWVFGDCDAARVVVSVRSFRFGVRCDDLRLVRATISSGVEVGVFNEKAVVDRAACFFDRFFVVNDCYASVARDARVLT